MNQRDEIYALNASILAHEAFIVELCIALAEKEPALDVVIKQAFDNAANHIEDIAIQLGTAASPKHTVKALEIIEGMRANVAKRVA